jgi:hypothetical protein
VAIDDATRLAYVEVLQDERGATATAFLRRAVAWFSTYEVSATRAGRRVEVTNARGVVEVSEVTRTGEPVRRARFMASRVLALVEHPAAEAGTRAVPAEADEQPSLPF